MYCYADKGMDIWVPFVGMLSSKCIANFLNGASVFRFLILLEAVCPGINLCEIQ